MNDADRAIVMMLHDNAALISKCERLQAENAKLRELVQKMMRFFEDGDWCDTCEVAKECDAQEQYEEDCLMRGVFHDRMRELGRGTCRFVWSLADNGWADHTCSACGYVENTDVHVRLGWKYCPNCGARVVDA